MRLLRLQLRNYCQHRLRDVSFHEGLNALIGPIGTGKTNLLNAVVWLLTGEDRNAGKNADNICQLAGKGEPSSATLEFEHAGARMALERKLPSGQSLKIGSETLTKARDIDERLLKVLGVTSELLTDYVFVPQWGMFDFLAHTDAKRSDAFAKLFGLDEADACYQALTDNKLEVPPLTTDGPELEGRLAALQLEGIKVQEQLKAYAQLPDPWRESEDPSQVVVTRYRHEQNVVAAQQRLKSQIDQLLVVRHDQDVHATQKAGEVQLVRQAVEEDAEAIVQCRQELAVYEARQRDARRRQETEERLRYLEKTKPAEPEKPEHYFEADDPACQRMNELDQERIRIHKYLETGSAEGLPKCPTCGTPAETLRVKLPELQFRLGEVCHDLDPLKAIWDTSERYRQACRTWKPQIQAWSREYEWLRTQLPPTPHDQPAPRSLPELRAKIEEYEELKRGLFVLEREKNHAATELAATNGRLVAFRAELAVLPSLSIPLVSDADFECATIELRLRVEQAQERDKLKQKYSRIAILRTEVETSLKTWREREAKSQRIRTISAHLSVVRDLFHRNNLPRRLIEGRLQLLVGDINMLLERFQAPFRCLHVEGTRFVVRFHDGREHFANRLSGGERVLFALAFRVAVNATSDLNLLCLDEPTAGLDAASQACLGKALDRLRELSRQRGLQVILVTHEKGPQIYDQVIELAA